MVQTCSHPSLGFFLVDSLDALHDHALALNLDSLDYLLLDKLLVLTLKKREIYLDAVEVGAVGNVEDRPRLQALACLEDLLGLLHLQVVHEDGELLPRNLAESISTNSMNSTVVIALGWMV